MTNYMMKLKRPYRDNGFSKLNSNARGCSYTGYIAGQLHGVSIESVSA